VNADRTSGFHYAVTLQGEVFKTAQRLDHFAS